jgi:hypothetical protein
MRDIIRADAERRFANAWTRPVGAWLVACFASAAALVAAFGVIGAVGAWPSAPDIAEFAAAIIPGTLYFGAFMIALTAIPTLIFAWIMHSQGWKKIYTSALFGGLTGAGVLQLFGFPIRHGAEAIPVTMMFFCVGLVGGGVYRLVAGKH